MIQETLTEEKSYIIFTYSIVQINIRLQKKEGRGRKSVLPELILWNRLPNTLSLCSAAESKPNSAQRVQTKNPLEWIRPCSKSDASCPRALVKMST